jgi:sulfoxide reductase heme-binding subunit YedZ
MDTRYQPWLDRSGRLSPLKATVFVLLFVPGFWVALQLWQGWLAPKPVTEAIHQIGTWIVRFLLLSLAITPLRSLAGWNKLITVRRMIGVAALAYAAVHFALYIVDQHGDMPRVASEIALRFYLTIGFIALVGLAVLGGTSTDGMIRRFGAKAWNRLHQIVYVIGVLALWHFLLQAKLDITEPALMSGLFLILMGWRGLRKLSLADSIVGLALLAVLCALGTAFLEAGWYQVVNHVPYRRVLQADLDFSGSLRPAWWVLAAGLGVVLIRLCRPLWTRKGKTPQRPRPVRPAAEALTARQSRAGVVPGAETTG